MTYTFHIKRQENSETQAYWQDFTYTSDSHDSVASALLAINETTPLRDANGKETTPIGWQRSCLIRKCGACAMRINGLPRLACSTFLADLHTKTVILEPLGKFPVIHDLIVNRSVIYTMLQDLSLWQEKGEEPSRWLLELHRQSARCLSCGCCLEICPNFTGQADFIGALGAVNAFRHLDTETPSPHKEEMEKAYKTLHYDLCSQSLACHQICPASIPVEDLMAHSTARAIWHTKR